MAYLFAIFLPPVAFLMVGRPGLFVLSLLLCLTLVGWLPAAIWALLVVNEEKANKRAQRLQGA